MSLENFKNRKIEWDTVNKNFDQSVQIVSGDVNSRTVTIVITDKGEPINLTGYSVKLVYKYIYNDNSGFVMLTPTDAPNGEFSLTIPTEMTSPGSIKSNLILLNENLEQVIVSKSIKFISDDSTVTDLAQEVNNKIDDFTKLLLSNMPQVIRSELNDLHAKTESNTSNIELKANSSDMTSLQSAMNSLQNKVEAFGITPENLVTIKSLLDAIANNATDSEVAELINSVNVLTSNISLMSDGDYSPKANKTDLESLQHTVNNQSATISTKASQTDLDNLQTTVTSQGIAISTKAEQAEIIQARGGQSSLDSRLDGIEQKEATDIQKLQSDVYGISTVMSNKINNVNEVIELRHLSQEVKASITGGSTAVVGTNAVNTTNIADKAVTNVKLSDEYANLGQLPNWTDYDFLIREGSYLVFDGTNTYYNYPPALVGKTKILNINVATTGSTQSNKFITQIARVFNNPKDAYVRTVQVSGSTIISKKDWTSFLSVSNANLDSTFLSGGVMANNTDLNNIFREVRYLLIGDNYLNVPSDLKGSTLMFTSEAYSSNFFIQKLTKTNSPTVVYSRTVQKASQNNIYGNWTKHYLDPSSSEKLVGKTIYNFGDSTIGNTNDATSVSSQLASMTGATIFNVGFGGCHMSQHAVHWDAFSMYRLADAITTGDYTLQDAAIAANPYGMPAYFDSHLTLLKNADWANVDFITIGYGTNDYAFADLIDNPDNPKDTTTFLGAFRYSIEKFLNKYPHLKILVTTPMYRFWMNDDGTYKNDSDTVSYNTNNDTLDKFADAIVAESKKYHLPILNLYADLGINKFNRAVYFPSNDGTHHNEAGRKRIAEKLASGLSSY